MTAIVPSSDAVTGPARSLLSRVVGPGLGLAALAFQSWLAASTGYLLALLAAGARYTDPPSDPGGGESPRLAVLVPAHDEERGVAEAVHALVAQDYPAAQLDVIVIADNCTDDTAGVAATAGATVWERHDLSARGKGQALGWALARLRAESRTPEAVLVVDADCIASPNLCAVVAEEIADPGVHAIQARYDVSNPEESATAALRAAGFILKHVIRSRGRARLGLSCGLFGSGMAFRTSLFDEVQWPTSVTEDTELHLELIQRGVVVRYAERASVRSAMPTTAAAAVDQQLRWESGNAQLAGSQLVGLLTRGAATGDVQLLAAAAELLAPSQTMLAAGSLGLGGLSAVLGRRRTAALAAATLTGQAGYVLGGLLAAGAPPASLRALVHAPGFALARLRILGRVASGRRAQTWVRTARDGAED
jgi:1,2-diacylglycerol 3-beta-glucosyltransferase